MKRFRNLPSAERLAFYSALILGFVSHLFVYTGRYWGRDDRATVYYVDPVVASGRWFNTIINKINLGYVVPFTAGLYVTLFLSVSAYFICKTLSIRNKVSALLVGGLLATYPSIAFTNIFLRDTSNYHFGVILGVLAVFVTVKYRFGCIAGAILAMFTLAIYQAKFSIVITLSIIFLIKYLFDINFTFKIFYAYCVKFATMAGLGSILYSISLPIAFNYYDTTFNNYRGFSSDSIINRLFAFSELRHILSKALRNFMKGLLGHDFFASSFYMQICLTAIFMATIFALIIVINRKLYQQPIRIALIALLTLSIPFTSNISDILSPANSYGLMMYAFVLTLVFCILLSDEINIIPIAKTVFSIIIVFIIVSNIIGNNIYYMKAYYFNERTTSLTTRILARIEPYLTEVDEKRVGLFGTLPNEYYPESHHMFREYGFISDGAGLKDNSYIGYQNNSINTVFSALVDRLHGLHLQAISDHDTEEKYLLSKKILDSNMPVWPANDSIRIIDGIIVVNFGIADIILEEDEDGYYFRTRHYISDGHIQHKYQYDWSIYANGMPVDNLITDSAVLRYNLIDIKEISQIYVTIKNVTIDYELIIFYYESKPWSARWKRLT